MKKRKLADLLKRFTAKTPAANKKRGRLMTVIGVAATAAITLGVVTNPIGLVALYTTAILTGGSAVYDGAQVETKKEENGKEENGKEENA